jgi:hypothetical protein
MALESWTVGTYLLGSVIMVVGVVAPLAILAYRYVLKPEPTETRSE